MADYENLFADEDFVVEHLFTSPENHDLIQSFSVGNSAMGLEIFLKEVAEREESEKQTRTYLIKDRITGELVCYFSMRTGLVTLQVDGDDFDSLSAVELSNFAMNQVYKANHPNAKRLGSYFFKRFILPLAQFVSEYIGVSTLYIYALPEDKLMNHYKKLGFSRLPEEQEKFVQNHVKPKYDEGCIFMYQPL
ncbi:MAG: hypothetical protein II220_00765 [Spirochaetales bacterium]|nr:hypothetical protein [Spirochaetales bacterium]